MTQTGARPIRALEFIIKRLRNQAYSKKTLRASKMLRDGLGRRIMRSPKADAAYAQAAEDNKRLEHEFTRNRFKTAKDRQVHAICRKYKALNSKSKIKRVTLSRVTIQQRERIDD